MADDAHAAMPSEAMIQALVHGFYGKIRIDSELGPIFNRAIADWDPHLEKMCAFWSSVMCMSGRYHGNPMATHLRLKTVRTEHFQRWLALSAKPPAISPRRVSPRNSRPRPKPSPAACRWDVLPPAAAAAIPQHDPGLRSSASNARHA